MRLESTVVDGVTVVSFADEVEIDLAGSEAFRAAFEQEAGEAARVVFDASNVAFFDSAAMGVLLSVSRSVEARKGAIALCGLRRPVLEVFRMVGVDLVIPIHPDRAAAVASLASSDAAG